MKRKLPVCALCGKTLVRKARMLIELNTADKHFIGWHAKCATDPCCAAITKYLSMGEHEYTIPKAIGVIQNRGANRVMVV